LRAIGVKGVAEGPRCKPTEKNEKSKKFYPTEDRSRVEGRREEET